MKRMASPSCGTSRIVGSRFALYVMSDRFAEIILTALKEVDSSKVWLKTDDLTTCIRGRSSHVFDVAKALFVHAANTGEHVVFNGTFSIGCPGDTEGDSYMSGDDVKLNEADMAEPSRKLEAACHFALYPMNREDYMDVIYESVDAIKASGVSAQGVHYASRLDGNAETVFAALEQAFEQAQKSDLAHLVMTAVVSANSPTKTKMNEVN
jgi:uncharacterized protein YqgV (UPF0045/DUF77 family)